jgi:hypothetical protein
VNQLGKISRFSHHLKWLLVGVRTFMNSFNELEWGFPATGKSICKDVPLKGDWGFDGFVVSRLGGALYQLKLIAHGYAKTVSKRDC